MAGRLLALACALALAAGRLPAAHAATGAEVVGAGATFPAPALQAWAEQFSRESAASVRYEPVGSGAGIRSVTARSADFAVTDVPLTQAELAQDDLLQLPLIAGAVVPVVNLPGLGDGALQLSGPVLADIYLGRITRWDDPALRALNPGQKLPALPIVALHRGDGSGTSFLFTYYLSAVSSAWLERLGIGSRLVWPVGVAATGSERMAQLVHDTVGAIGYVEAAYAQHYDLSTVQLRNKAGNFILASARGVRAALASARWSRPGYYEVPVDRDGADSWPIVGVSFVLLHERQEDHADALATLHFLRWTYAQGGGAARRLDYVPLDDPELLRRIESCWRQIRDDQGQTLPASH